MTWQATDQYKCYTCIVCVCLTRYNKHVLKTMHTWMKMTELFSILCGIIRSTTKPLGSLRWAAEVPTAAAAVQVWPTCPRQREFLCPPPSCRLRRPAGGQVAGGGRCHLQRPGLQEQTAQGCGQGTWPSPRTSVPEAAHLQEDWGCWECEFSPVNMHFFFSLGRGGNDGKEKYHNKKSGV